MRRLYLWAAFALVGAAALAGGLYYGRQAFVPDRTSSALSDATPLMALALPDLNGTDQRLEQWKGKVLFVNFWATWCAPCREEMPEFIKAQREFGARGLQFVGIAVDDADKVRQFAAEIGLNYPALLGGYGAIELSRTLGNRVGALPFTIIIDRAGRVVHTQLGPMKMEQLNGFIAQLV
jgi:thiol-disulfide isomerase/thioredoxin